MIIRSDKLSLLPSLCYKAKRTVGFSPMAYNVLQISEGTNSVGIVRWIWAFAYVLLAVGFITNY